jgi:hypothetical protein
VRHSRLWALTCLFNPQRYRRRVANYRVFRRNLGVPLVAVEMSFDGRFELEEDDADILVRVEGGDVLWQKERLLNFGVSRLPPECRAVAVLDCDIVFENAAWPARALDCLERSPAVQLFSEAHFLRAGAESTFDLSGAQLRESSARAVRSAIPAHACLVPLPGNEHGRYTAGLGWAFRRELLEHHGLFDGCVIGGGDTALGCALWGAFEAVEERHAMSPGQASYYREWAQPLYARVRGNVDFVEGNLFHLWHGELDHRRRRLRHLDLKAQDFDPRRDIALHASGSWRWATQKPALHRLLVDYFAARREDG